MATGTESRWQDSEFLVESVVAEASGLKIKDSDASHTVTIAAGNESADRTLSIPVLGAADTMMTLGTAQSVTGAKTFTDARSLVTAASTAASLTNQGITTLGSTVAKTYRLAAPAAGVKKTLTALIGSTGAIHTVKASTGGSITFDGTNHIAKFNAAAETLDLVGLTATRWAIRGNVGSVALSTA